MCPSQIPEGATRGWIVPIGGGEDKENNPQILRRFVELCGGADADIVLRGGTVFDGTVGVVSEGHWRLFANA